MTYFKKFNQNKPAFTMIELIFVIIVLGVLAALAIPRMDRDLKQQAAESILSDIRYTQHLALSDYKHSNTNINWQKSFWRVGFNGCAGGGLYEYIGSDVSRAGGISFDEAALDPTNGKKMYWGTAACPNGGDSNTSDRIFLTVKYGISTVVASGGCATGQYIGFDHLGRPHVGFASTAAGIIGDTPTYSSYMTSTCKFRFTMSDGDTFDIDIEPETGYAHIVGQESS